MIRYYLTRRYDEISESQHRKWQDMMKSTEFSHSSRKVWKSINKLTKYYTTPQQQCRASVDQEGRPLLLNGKGNNMQHNPC